MNEPPVYSSPREAFVAGTRALFLRWTALALSVQEHGSSEVADDMLETLVYLCTDVSRPFNRDLLDEMLSDGFDRMGVDIEDGSLEDIVQVVVNMRTECLAGDYRRVGVLVERAKGAGLSEMLNRSLNGAGDQSEAKSESDGEGEGEGAEKAAMDIDDSTAAANRKTSGKVVDEDGFELVRSKR